MKMPEIGKSVSITYKEFREMNTLLFGRHGNLEISAFNEGGDDMHLVHLNIFQNTAERIFTPEELEDAEVDGEFEIHISTWQKGKGWIVDYSMTRKLLIQAAHIYEKPQPCINCDVYKKNVKILGKAHWGMYVTCQECLCGKDGWPNFTMEIKEE